MKRCAVSDRFSNGYREIPPFVVPVLIAVFVLGCTPLAVYTWRQVITDWQTVPADGEVVGVRFVKYHRPLPKARGPWHVVWEIACGEGGGELVSVTAVSSYTREIDAQEASRSDMGRHVTVWHVPGSDGLGDLSPPDRERGLFAAVWATAMATFGWLGVAGFVQLAWRKRGRLSVQAEPGDAADSVSRQTFRDV